MLSGILDIVSLTDLRLGAGLKSLSACLRDLSERAESMTLESFAITLTPRHDDRRPRDVEELAKGGRAAADFKRALSGLRRLKTTYALSGVLPMIDGIANHADTLEVLQLERSNYRQTNKFKSWTEGDLQRIAARNASACIRSAFLPQGQRMGAVATIGSIQSDLVHSR